MKKKIAVIGLKGLPALGGTATVGENIIDQLKDKYEFIVYATSTHTNLIITDNGIRQIVFKKFPISKLNIFYYYFASAIHALLFKKYDLIHLHLIDGAYILPFLKLRYKVIGTTHGRPYTIAKWNGLVNSFFRLNEKVFFRLTNRATSVSLPLIEKVSRLTKKEVIYIPNGIVKPKHLNLPDGNREGDYILFSARRFIEIKGCHLLLEALQIIGYTGKVKLIGDMGQVPEYSKKLYNLSSGLNVEFVGLITDKNELMRYIRECKLFVFPSIQEAMSIMLLEVASLGVPLICSNIPENTAVFKDEEVLYFETKNADDLAQKLEWALNNRDEMKVRSEKAFERLCTEYTWDTIALKYANAYNNVINANR